MPSTTTWYIDHRVIYIRLYGDVDVANMEQSSTALIAMLDAGKPLVHIILDDSQLGSIPTSLGQLRKSLPFLRHASLGWAVAVGKVNPVLSFLSSLIAGVFRIRHRRFETLSEALAFLKSIDATVDWSQANESVLPDQEQAR